MTEKKSNKRTTTSLSDKMLPYDTQNTDVIYESIDMDKNVWWNIVEINITDPTKNNRVPKHWHRSLEFILPIKNGTHCRMGNVSYDVEPGDVLLINSRCIHELRNTHQEDQYFGYAVQLNYNHLCYYIKNFDSIEFDSTFSEDTERIVSILKMVIYADDQEENTRNLMIQYQLDQLLMLLISRHSHLKENAGDDTRSERVMNIISYLDAHCTEGYYTDQIAEDLHLSYGYMAHLFKDEMKMSMNDYVNKARVSLAKKYLVNTNDPIENLSEQLGFSSLRSFIREFKRYTDMTPSQYRKEK